MFFDFMYRGYYDGIVLAAQQSPAVSNIPGNSCLKNNYGLVPTIGSVYLSCYMGIFLLNNLLIRESHR